MSFWANLKTSTLKTTLSSHSHTFPCPHYLTPVLVSLTLSGTLKFIFSSHDISDNAVPSLPLLVTHLLHASDFNGQGSAFRPLALCFSSFLSFHRVSKHWYWISLTLIELSFFLFSVLFYFLFESLKLSQSLYFIVCSQVICLQLFNQFSPLLH